MKIKQKFDRFVKYMHTLMLKLEFREVNPNSLVKFFSKLKRK